MIYLNKTEIMLVGKDTQHTLYNQGQKGIANTKIQIFGIKNGEGWKSG